MAKTSYANQQFLIKPETVYGTEKATVGAGFSRMNAMRGDFQNTMEVDIFTASGHTAASIATLNDEFAEGDIEGRADYNSIIFILASLFGAPTTTETEADSGAFEHVFEYDGITPLVPQSYTASVGQAGAGGADNVLGLIFDTLGLSGGRDGFDLSSSAWGKAMTIGSTLGTVGAGLDVEPIPVSPLHGSIFLDSTAAGLGTTRLLDIYNLDIAFGERLGRARPINSLLTSDGVIELADQEHTVQLQFMVDAVERARYAKARNGTKEFVQVTFTPPTGGEIADSGENYELTFEFCLLWTESGAGEDTDGVITRPWTGRIARDATWEMATRVFVRNSMAAIV